jgi:hypothetical protein
LTVSKAADLVLLDWDKLAYPYLDRGFVFLHELVGVTVDEPPSLFLQPKRLGDRQFHDG